MRRRRKFRDEQTEDWRGTYLKVFDVVLQSPGIGPNEALVYSLLSSMQRGKAAASPSQPYIAKRLNISTRTVRRSISTLKDLNFITVMPYRSGDGKIHNVYSVNEQLIRDLQASRRKTAKTTLDVILSGPNAAKLTEAKLSSVKHEGIRDSCPNPGETEANLAPDNSYNSSTAKGIHPSDSRSNPSAPNSIPH